MKDVEYYYGKYAKRLLKPEHLAEAVNDILIERDAELKTIPVEAGVMQKIAEAEKKIEGYSQIINWLLKNHYKFGDMELPLLKKIESVGTKYDF